MKLPKGYYAVTSAEAEGKTSFTYKGVSYEVTEGENLFSSLKDAAEAAVDVPETVLSGLSYDRFDTPVLLCDAGEHPVHLFYIEKSLTILGENAGVNPNVWGDGEPSPNPLRLQNESVLLGSYWFGKVLVRQYAAEKIIIDGFSGKWLRFIDERVGGEKAFVAVRNFIHVSPCGWDLYRFSQIKPDCALYREVELINIRLTDYDDCAYGGMFLQLSATRATLSGICYANTTQIFGPTNITRTICNVARNAETTELIIKNSYFANMQGENGISTGAAKDGEKLLLTVEDTVFYNASRENEAPLRPFISESSKAVVKNCRFIDTRENSGVAIEVFGSVDNLEVINCEFSGFKKDYAKTESAPESAPQFIDTTPRDTDCADSHKVLKTDEKALARLSEIYKGTRAYYGDLHVHTACGGTSDGRTPMAEWPSRMDEIDLDFAAVVDHRQMRGFFLPEWSEERFIIGTEPAANLYELNDCQYDLREVHYNMLFPHKYALSMVLANFPEFEFSGNELTGSFKYPGFTKERFFELTEFIHSLGGMMVHPHPCTMMYSKDPVDYYFGEHTYLETLYETYDSHASFKNYDLWVELLNLGKHVYASGGSDTHFGVTNAVVSTFYTDTRSGKTFFDKMKTGDFTVGAVGIKMLLGDALMGSETEYREGDTLTIKLSDFYSHELRENTAYELRVYTDKGLAYASQFDGKEEQTLTLAVQDRAYYRAEVIDLTHGYRVAVGNPIWLDK